TPAPATLSPETDHHHPPPATTKPHTMTIACLQETITPADLNILSLLTKTPQGKFNDRRPRLDPLILETAALSSPAQTRNHYLHSYHAQHQPQQKQHHQAESDLDSTSTCSTFSRSPSSSPGSSPDRRHHRSTLANCIR
ncbi:hypothetical protein PTTG_26159, partial [Puccinia triticina 1-1 BBBD Race 1]